MIQPYLKGDFPPVPVLEISLAVSTTTHWYGPFIAIVDSGADFTIVPALTLRPLNLIVERQAVIRSQWRDRHLVEIYNVDVQIGGLVFPNLEVAGDANSDDFVLGRNILNYLDLRLDGPRQQLHLLSR